MSILLPYNNWEARLMALLFGTFFGGALKLIMRTGKRPLKDVSYKVEVCLNWMKIRAALSITEINKTTARTYMTGVTVGQDGAITRFVKSSSNER